MITATKIAAENNEAAVVNTAAATDEIKRNHLQTPALKPVVTDFQATEFTVKFARLKKALRRRTSSIF